MVTVTKTCVDDAAVAVRKQTFGEMELVQRLTDQYVDATDLCRRTGKKLNHYLANQGTKDVIEQMALDAGIPASSLVQVRKGRAKGESLGGGQGTWLHPDLAIDFVRWACPRFAIAMARWVRELLTTGEVRLDGASSGFVQVPAGLLERLDGRVEHLQQQVDRLTAHPTAMLAPGGIGARLPGPFWTVAAWLEENMPQWDATAEQRHAIGQDAKKRVHRACPTERVEYFNRDLAFQAHQEWHLAKAAQKAFAKAEKENKARVANRIPFGDDTADAA